MESYYDINQPDNVDAFLAFVKGAVNIIPGGSFFDEYWVTFLGSPLEKRRSEWFQELYETVVKLEAKSGIDVASLRDNDEFIDTILTVTPLAQATSHKEKRMAFRNALANIATGSSPGQTKSGLFIRLIENFTVDHLRVLQFLDYPEKWFKDRNLETPFKGIPNQRFTLEEYMTEGRCNVGEDAVTNLIFTDLYNSGLVNSRYVVNSNGLTKPEAEHRRTTSIGREFLSFITLDDGQPTTF
jgi:hypothetical protein